MPGMLDRPPPRRLVRGLMRLPIWMYRLRLGWALGHRFLMLTHTGRRSGLQRRAVLEVVCHDATSGTYVVASGWGARSDWFQNILKTPRVQVDVAGRHWDGIATQLGPPEAELALRDYARRHPWAFRELAGIIFGNRFRADQVDYAGLAQALPLVVLRPSE